MPRRVPLPPHLVGASFRSSDEAFHGVGRKRLRSPDVGHPFTGVSSVGLDLDSTVGRCIAYAPLLRPGEAFSHATAAELYGLPLPRAAWSVPLHVLSPPGVSRARTAGTVGHESSTAFELRSILGFPVVAPELAWCQLAAILDAGDLTAVGDALVTGRRNGRSRDTAATSIERLGAAVEAWGRRRGRARLDVTLPRVRVGAESRPETLLRLLLVERGFPEPVIAHPIPVDGGATVLHPDLAYPRWRLALEYEGEHHRAVKHWKRDITRREQIEAEGWRIVRVTSDDVFVHPDAFIARLRRVIRGIREAAGN